MKLVYLMAVCLMLSACASTPEPMGIAALKTPYDTDQWVRQNIDSATLERWDKAVSDDVILVEFLEMPKKLVREKRR